MLLCIVPTPPLSIVFPRHWGKQFVSSLQTIYHFLPPDLTGPKVSGFALTPSGLSAILGSASSSRLPLKNNHNNINYFKYNYLLHVQQPGSLVPGVNQMAFVPIDLQIH
jgi:hypothetical protein